MSGHDKILWQRPTHPDSYIPPGSFLSSLRKNPNFYPYTYWHLVTLSFPVTQHLATTSIFLSVFVKLRENTLDPRTLVWITCLGFVLGYVVWELQDYARGGSGLRRVDRVKHLKSSILIFLSLMSLSPVLKTLSAATSSDSIWALSATLFILNALLADYGSTAPAPYMHAHQERLTSVLSMNAAISSSVVLASRLHQDLAVFSLILFSVQVFALFPMLRRRFQHSYLILQGLLTVSLTATSLLLTDSLPRSVYLVIFVFVTFLAPGALVWAQKFKNEIRGPWDVAVPKDLPYFHRRYRRTTSLI